MKESALEVFCRQVSFSQPVHNDSMAYNFTKLGSTMADIVDSTGGYSHQVKGLISKSLITFGYLFDVFLTQNIPNYWRLSGLF
jgi:hypothetical protein